jgi:hypothetical protein
MTARFAVLLSLLVTLIILPTAAAQEQSPFSSVPMDLALTPVGADWKADVRFTVSGREITESARSVRVTDDSVEFAVTLLGAEVRFSGALAGGKLEGNLEAVENGQRIATGAWSLAVKPPAKPAAEPDGSGSPAGSWTGTFSAKRAEP